MGTSCFLAGCAICPQSHPGGDFACYADNLISSDLAVTQACILFSSLSDLGTST